MTLLLAFAMLVPVAVAARVIQVAGRDDRSPVDVIVVLGAAAAAGRPGEVLEARLDHARELYLAGTAPVIVTAGGTGESQDVSEAAAGAAYLTDNGVPAEAVIAVEVGGDTLSSLQAVRDQAAISGWTSMVLVTDPWHSYRAQAMARDVGLPVTATSPTHTGPNVTSGERVVFNVVRETAAFIAYRVESLAAPLL